MKGLSHSGQGFLSFLETDCLVQTESPSAPGSRKTSGDQATTLPRQKTAPVFVPGSLPGDGHVQVNPQWVRCLINTPLIKPVGILLYICLHTRWKPGQTAESKYSQ